MTKKDYISKEAPEWATHSGVKLPLHPKIDPVTGEIRNHDYVTQPFVRSPYNYNMDAESEATGLHCPEDTRTQQHDKEDADINTIVKRFGLTGEMPIIERIPLNEDFIGITDYHQAAIALKNAQDQFMTLPADIRSKFDNDPGTFLDFTSKEENRAEMEKMGFMKKKEQSEPVEVRIAAGGHAGAPAPGGPTGTLESPKATEGGKPA